MASRQDDVRAMIVALYTVMGQLQGAGRRGPAATLGLLRLIAEHPGIRPSDAAIELGIHQSTVSRQMQSLESAGLVKAKTVETDRRASSLSITPAGRAEIKKLSEGGFAAFASFLESWSDDDVRRLCRLLQKFIDTLAEVRKREEAKDL